MNTKKILPLTTALVLGAASLTQLHAARNSKMDPEEESKYKAPPTSIVSSKSQSSKPEKKEKKEKKSKSKKKVPNQQDTVDPTQKQRFLKGASYLPLQEFNKMMSTLKCRPQELFSVTSSGFPKFLNRSELEGLQRTYGKIRGLNAVVKGGILEDLGRVFLAESYYGNKEVVAVHFEDEHRTQGTKLQGLKKEAELVTYYVFLYDKMDQSFTPLAQPLKLVVNFHATEEVAELPQNLIATPMEAEFLKSLRKKPMNLLGIANAGPEFLSHEEVNRLWNAKEEIVENRGIKYEYTILRDVLGARITSKPAFLELENKPLTAVLFSGANRGFGTNLKDFDQDSTLATYFLCYQTENGLEPIYVPRTYLEESGVSPLKFDVTFHFVKSSEIINADSTDTVVIKGPNSIKASVLKSKLKKKPNDKN